MKNFKEDVKIGEAVQKFLVKELKPEFGKIKCNTGQYEEYDLECNGYTIEVKFDRKSEFTNNTAIEYKYKGNPSGISTTPAIEWIQVFYSDGWVYTRTTVNNLKAYLKNNWEHLNKTKGGDNMWSDLILIKKDDFINAFDFVHIDSKL